MDQFAQYYRSIDSSMMHGSDSDSLQWIFLLGFVVLAGLIIGSTIYITRKIAASSTASQENNLIDVARERFVKGEITKDELADIKKELAQ